MSTVYLARDIKTGETVAVKVMDERLANDASYINRFEREAEIGISLNHPNIAKIIAHSKENGSYFIIIEYVQGITLLDYIRRNGKLTVNETTSITLQILSALSYAYSKGVQAHRDIKPNNIMIELKNNNVKVMDFGISKTIDTYLTHSTSIFTPLYGSPEQLNPSEFGNKIDARTDIYSLGIMLYEMLAGKPPFSGLSVVEIFEQKKKGAIPLLSNLRKDVPKYLSQIVIKCLRPDPDKRYQSPEELISDLKNGVCSEHIEKIDKNTKESVEETKNKMQKEKKYQTPKPPQVAPSSQPIKRSTIKPIYIIIPAVIVITALVLLFLLKERNVPISITSYPSSAKLYIDESYIGDTPINSYKLSIGSHMIKILKDGYKEYNTSVNINSETNPEMKFTLAALTGTISVSSNPSGAEVYINNDNKGVTPLTVILIPGNYTVNITKDGYSDYTTTSTVNPDLISTVNPVLKKNTGTLSVSSSPADAQIYLNGSYKGVTPLTLTISPGSYSVKINKDGYKDYTSSTTVKTDTIVKLNATLEKIVKEVSIVWKYKTNDEIGNSYPIISSEKVYVTSGNCIYCLKTSDGSLIWKYETSRWITSPVIYNGKIFIGSNDYVFCLDAYNGSLLWKYEVVVGYFSYLTVYKEQIYFSSYYYGSDYTYIYCLNASNGSLVWRYQTDQKYFGSLSAIDNGKLYFASYYDGYIYCLNASNGSLVWRYQTDQKYFGSLSAIDNGKLYFASDDGYVYCYSTSNGSFIWKHQVTSSFQDITSGPVVYKGKVYVGLFMDGKLCCLDANNGSLLWTYKTGSISAPFPLFYNEKIYIGTYDGYVHCINASNGSNIWKYKIGSWLASSPAFYNGKLYIGSRDTYFYCLDIGE